MSKWTFNPGALLSCKLKAEKSVRKLNFQFQSVATDLTRDDQCIPESCRR